MYRKRRRSLRASTNLGNQRGAGEAAVRSAESAEEPEEPRVFALSDVQAQPGRGLQVRAEHVSRREDDFLAGGKTRDFRRVISLP
jgi:hypothetical protein